MICFQILTLKIKIKHLNNFAKRLKIIIFFIINIYNLKNNTKSLIFKIELKFYNI